jgi:E3 ubiquitin-protein ligase RNF5
MESNYECRICLEIAKEPVVSQCGHLYCWSCINSWLQTSGGTRCPVCKSGISSDKLIPIYINNETPDSRSQGVPRPKPARQEPSNRQQPNPNYAEFVAGVGLFPGVLWGGMFSFTMNSNDARADIVSKVMLVIGMLIFLAILA